MRHLSFSTAFGDITVFEDGDALIALEWGRAPDGGGSPLLERARERIESYFSGDFKGFDLPLNPGGTQFQRAVWTALEAIPAGETRTYADVAKTVNSAPRAVGGACARNPLPILIPCHRVVGADGRMTGYSGAEGVETKTALLRLEGAVG